MQYAEAPLKTNILLQQSEKFCSCLQGKVAKGIVNVTLLTLQTCAEGVVSQFCGGGEGGGG
jgi:hypothetical protein